MLIIAMILVIAVVGVKLRDNYNDYFDYIHSTV